MKEWLRRRDWMKQNRLYLLTAVIILCLAGILTGCGKKEKPQSDFVTYPEFLDTQAQIPESGGTAAETEDTADGREDNSGEESVTVVHTFRRVSDTVKATAEVEVCDQPSAQGNVLGVVQAGDSIERTGIGSQGWDRVKLDGKTGYVDASRIEAEESGSAEDKETEPTKPPINEADFESCNETVYAKSPVNVRSGPSTAYDKIGGLDTADAVTRTGRGSQGWDRVIFQDRTAYIHTSYLVTEKPEVPTQPPSNPVVPEQPPENQPAAQNQTVYAAVPLNIQAQNNNESEVLGHLEAGDAITRISVGTDGWAVVSYNGQTAYVENHYLTEAMPQ